MAYGGYGGYGEPGRGTGLGGDPGPGNQGQRGGGDTGRGGEGGTAPQTGGGRGGRRSGRTGPTAQDTTQASTRGEGGLNAIGVLSQIAQSAQDAYSGIQGLFDTNFGFSPAPSVPEAATPTSVDPTGQRGITDAEFKSRNQAMIDSMRDRGVMAGRIASGASLLGGPLAGIAGVMARMRANQMHESLTELNQRDPMAAGRAIAAENLRGYEPGEGGEVAQDRIERERQAAKDAAGKPEKPKPEMPEGMSEDDKWWWEATGINPNDPNLYEPEYTPGRTNYLSRVGQDIRAAREAARPT